MLSTQPSRVLRCTLLALAVTAALPAAAADLTELSLEQLANTEVTGVSKTAERLLDAPASVSVITAEDIRNFGYRSFAELLNGVRGIFTYGDRLYGYAGVRGFAPPGDYNTRLLLLIDGYRANDNVYDQAALGEEGIIDLALVERVEVIRGPSSSVYGTNAFFGVINVVTKSTTRIGSEVDAVLGAGRERGGGGSVAGTFGDGGSYALRASVRKMDGFDVKHGDEAVRGMDGSQVGRLFAKIVNGNLRINAGYSERTKKIGFGLYESDYPDPAAYATDLQRFIDARYEAAVSSQTTATYRAFAGAYRFKDLLTFGGDPNRGTASGDWLGTEAQLTTRLSPSHRLIAGVESQFDRRMEQRQVSEIDGVVLDDQHSGTRLGVFAQDDYSWTDRFSTSAGLRYDRYRGGANLSPRLAFIYKPRNTTAVKLITGSAFRAPNSFERYYALPGYYAPNPELDAERIRTIDLDVETMLSSSTRLAASLSRYRASNLISIGADEASGYAQYQNLGSASARGVDVELDHRASSRLRLRTALSWQSAVDGDKARLPNSPRVVGRADVTWQLTPNGWRLGAEGVHVARRMATDSSVPAYTITNVTFSSGEQYKRWHLGLSVYNLFDREVLDPVAVGNLPLGQDRVNMPARTWQLRASYAF